MSEWNEEENSWLDAPAKNETPVTISLDKGLREQSYLDTFEGISQSSTIACPANEF